LTEQDRVLIPDGSSIRHSIVLTLVIEFNILRRRHPPF